MTRLTDEERSFRKIGSGIPFSRWWPLAIMLIAWLLTASTVPDLFQNCVGYALEGRGKGRALARLLLAVPCSPYLFREEFWGWTLFLGMWAPIPIAFVNWRWARRQRVYWNSVRRRENERRHQKRAERAEQTESDVEGA